jgi:hypothetical protein
VLQPTKLEASHGVDCFALSVTVLFAKKSEE